MGHSVKIADLSIELRYEQDVLVNDNFLPFLADHEAAPECAAQITMTDSLKSTTGIQVGKDFDNDVFKLADGSFIRKYFQPPQKCYYAESTQSKPGFSAEVFILRDKKPENFDLNQLFHMIGWEQMLLCHDRLLLHAACIDTQYGGILFSGPSGIGKSTQEKLWKDCRGARGINGDRPVLYRKECWRAYGSPMAGSSGEHFNESVPIRAIVMLQQGNENTIRRLSLQEAFHAIYAGTTVYIWDREYVDRTLNLVLALVSEVPVYRLVCTPDEQAVLKLETVLKEDGGRYGAD